MDVRLPPALGAAVAERLEGRSRRAFGARRAEQTQGYRSHRTSREVVRGEDDALAYAMARMPATFAAVCCAFEALREAAPDFAPRSVLDVGCGPGTASWAATQAWPELEAVTLMDHSGPFLALAGELAASSPHPALLAAGREARDLAAGPPPGRFDLVVLSYAFTELPEARIGEMLSGLWAACAGALVIVEPGTPRDHARLLQARAALVGQGARIAAPCTHEAPCPMAGGDWCHFTVRVQRSRDHRLLKGASVPYEDEPFSYLAAVRADVPLKRARGRIVRPVARSKFSSTLTLCSAAGLTREEVGKRDAEAFRALRKADWGDAV